MPATAKKLLTSYDIAHLATTTVGSQLRIRHDVMFTELRRHDRKDEAARTADDTIRNSALFLELTLVAVCGREALTLAGTDTIAESAFPSFVERVKALTGGLDPVRVIAEATPLLKNLPIPVDTPMPPMSEIVRGARTVIESCPITMLENLGADRGLQDWGHRCRVAYEALRAFVLRQDPREQDRLGIVGREYARGALSLKDVAALLRVDDVDAVVLLEEHAYTRPLETILLGDEERLARYVRIREDRLNRNGKFEPTPELIARDVIASERIEGVDARPWIRPKVD